MFGASKSHREQRELQQVYSRMGPVVQPQTDLQSVMENTLNVEMRTEMLIRLRGLISRGVAL